MCPKDFNFPANVPRIFTSNAMTPMEFLANLPTDPWSMSDETRCMLNAEVKAVFKRTCFALVTHSMVPDEVRAEHQKRRRRGDA